MHNSVVARLESLAVWRADLDRRLLRFARFLGEQELESEIDSTRIERLRERLANDHVLVAFVAEFSRGKSELINAIFFAGAGRRMLPATPGRTTMCPVELGHDAQRPAQLMLLPIDTRLQGHSLAELRGRESAWRRVELDPGDAGTVAEALAAVTQTRLVTVDQAAALGFWNDEQPQDNPPLGDDGMVEVPAWRHAVINYPHPLLSRGMVVLDTPGLNAIGAEPELTLGLLPTAHAAVFVLAADAGVTRSDLEVWREHLGEGRIERFVVLNKIDTLVDPLLQPMEVESQIERQVEDAARALGMPADRVFPISARDALSGRVSGDDALLRKSRLPELEEALARELIPRQREMLGAAAAAIIGDLRASVAHRIGDRRRQSAEQMLELRGLRGKSGTKLKLMAQRVEAEAAEFERCVTKIAALRAVKSRMLNAVLATLASESLRSEVAAMQAALADKPLNLGAKQAFGTLCSRLRRAVANASQQVEEMRQMLAATFKQLNGEFGFSFTVPEPPALERFDTELRLLESSYARYLTITRAWRLTAPGFKEQFRRMLLSKLRKVFETAAADVEMWSKGATNPIDQQLRERRAAFQHRREAMQRVQLATGELEQRIGEVETQDQHWVDVQRRFEVLAGELIERARSGPAEPERNAA
jgi:hypothetical protein